MIEGDKSGKKKEKERNISVSLEANYHLQVYLLHGWSNNAIVIIVQV